MGNMKDYEIQMMQAGLSQATIDKMKAWIDKGHAELKEAEDVQE